MRFFKKKAIELLLVFLASSVMSGCFSSPSKKNKMQITQFNYEKGSYGYDLQFLSQNNVKFVELLDPAGGARLVLVPSYQGRVLTSTAENLKGNSFGWLNYDLIASGRMNNKFNPVGGEERLWLGPEGGPFSIYFDQKAEQTFDNWRVPPLIDTDTFDIIEQTSQSVVFTKKATVKNAFGTPYSLKLNRQVSLLTTADISKILNIKTIPPSLKSVAYKSVNTIQNTGDVAWSREAGLLSIWMLSMFKPTASTVVFLPFKTEAEGRIVKDDYFGKVTSERLKIVDNTIFFRVDGKQRSKIGIPYHRAKELCGSYDYVNKIFTLVYYSLPERHKPYVNSQWGHQENPFGGDVINAYNDGPVEDGSVMGPFYEIETSSPGAELSPNESLTHVQCIMHFKGEEEELGILMDKLFKLKIDFFKTVFE